MPQLIWQIEFDSNGRLANGLLLWWRTWHTSITQLFTHSYVGVVIFTFQCAFYNKWRLKATLLIFISIFLWKKTNQNISVWRQYNLVGNELGYTLPLRPFCFSKLLSLIKTNYKGFGFLPKRLQWARKFFRDPMG